MTNDMKSPHPDDDETTGKDGATTSIEKDGQATGSHDYNGQQGAAGAGGLEERSRPNPAGSQPHLGGSDASRSGEKAGTGLSENSDPASREKVPDLTTRDDNEGRAPGSSADVTKTPPRE